MRYSAARASPSRMWVKYVSSSALTEAISLSVEDKTGEERRFEYVRGDSVENYNQVSKILTVS